MGKVDLKFISNDYVSKLGCVGEHGNSILIENQNGKVLFDTGQGIALEHNLEVLDWHLDNLDAIAISHGHNDHIGGLMDVLNRMDNQEVLVYGHRDILVERLKVHSEGEKPTGSPYTKKELEAAGAKFVFNDGPVEIIKGIRLTGPIPRRLNETNTKVHFQIIDNEKVQDPFLDDQALIIESSKGLIIVFGCAHAGVINTMNYVEELTGEKTFYGLFGGVHLLEATEDILKNTLDEIEKRDVKVLGFNHCTGIKSISYFQNNFSGEFVDASTGFSIAI